MKNINKIKLLFLFALMFMAGVSMLNCAGKSPAAGGSDDPMPDLGSEVSPELEDSKQAAESAEWEAHRLREELNRKNKASQ